MRLLPCLLPALLALPAVAHALGSPDGQLITDGRGEREFAVGSLAAPAATLTLAPRGGFVARFR